VLKEYSLLFLQASSGLFPTTVTFEERAVVDVLSIFVLLPAIEQMKNEICLGSLPGQPVDRAGNGPIFGTSFL
jgi:hypothetical protein